MVRTTLPFADTLQFSKLIADYINGNDFLRSLSAFDLQMQSFDKAIAERKKFKVNRNLLANELLIQYQSTVFANELTEDDSVLKNLLLLRAENTFTVTTGHQLNIFTGPLYFVYKILSAVKLCEELKKKYADHNFVPVYWMATEDHDYDEIKSVFVNGKNIVWDTNQSGAVGRFQTTTFKKATEEFCDSIFDGTDAQLLKEMIRTAYLKNNNLANAMRSLVHSLMGRYGLVVMDADSAAFKKQAIDLFKQELETEFSFHTHEQSTQKLADTYGLQVHPRDINLFYLKDGLRERIIKGKDGYQVHHADIHFTKEQLIKELETYPERFSPNVILRPLYQETILPNIAYVGGPAEVHYWLQLKNVFETAQVYYPMVLLRNCLLMVSKESRAVMQKAGIEVVHIFKPADELLKAYVKASYRNELNMEQEQHHAKLLFEKIKQRVTAVDPTLERHADAEAVKFFKRLKATEEKMLRAIKRKEDVQATRIEKFKQQLFPGNGMQERKENIFPYLSEHGLTLLDDLKNAMQPLAKEFLVLQFN